MRSPTYLAAIAAAGIVAAPMARTTALAGAANSADAQQSVKAQDTAVVQESAAIQNKAEDHLNKAKAILESVPADLKSAQLVVTKDEDDQEKAAKRIARLKEQFAELVSAYIASPGNSSPEWKMKFSDVERELSRIIGGGVYSSAMAAPAPQVVLAPTNPAVPTAAANASAAPTSPGTVARSGTPEAAGARIIGAPAAPGPPTQGLVPTANDVLGVGEPAAPGSIAVVPAPGTPAAAGGDAHPGTPAVLTVIPTRPASGEVQEGVVDVAAAKVSMIGIKELDLGIRRLLEQFRTELELFYTAPVNERRSS